MSRPRAHVTIAPFLAFRRPPPPRPTFPNPWHRAAQLHPTSVRPFPHPCLSSLFYFPLTSTVSPAGVRPFRQGALQAFPPALPPSRLPPPAALASYPQPQQLPQLLPPPSRTAYAGARPWRDAAAPRLWRQSDFLSAVVSVTVAAGRGCSPLPGWFRLGCGDTGS